MLRLVFYDEKFSKALHDFSYVKTDWYWLDWQQPLMIRYDWLLLPFLQAGVIYLSASSPAPPSEPHYFFFALTERILGNGWLSESNVSCLCCGTRISHITSVARSCNQNSLTFKKWWMWVMQQMKRHVLPACRHKEILKGACVQKLQNSFFQSSYLIGQYEIMLKMSLYLVVILMIICITVLHCNTCEEKKKLKCHHRFSTAGSTRFLN